MNKKTINIVGAGFTGLTMAYYLSKAGWHVNLFEKDAEVGGLAGSYKVGEQYLEKFYHHWFTSDADVKGLIKDLDREKNIIIRPIKNGMYFSNNFFKLSSPTDLLKFKPLSLIGRIRLGFVVLAVRVIKDWKKLEDITAKDWLIKICGKKGYSIVWEPLLKGKFGRYAEDVSAVWFWNKLKLRGGSRGEKGKEYLAYYKGGFGSLAESMVEEIKKFGGNVYLGNEVVEVDGQGIKTKDGAVFNADKTVLTIPFPVISKIMGDRVSDEYKKGLNKIQYLGNVCLTLELSHSLSEIYWLNVNDPGFPFVGVIEHTNFEPTESYKGRHIVYLSKYLPTDEALYNMTESEFYAYAIPFIKKMFPAFDETWVLDYHVWKDAYSQPLVTLHYSEIIPGYKTPLPNVLINTMAQIYPEDRGTNYAVREGRSMAGKIAKGEF
jgi:protoporphyrinogen oxidase